MSARQSENPVPHAQDTRTCPKATPTSGPCNQPEGRRGKLLLLERSPKRAATVGGASRTQRLRHQPTGEGLLDTRRRSTSSREHGVWRLWLEYALAARQLLKRSAGPARVKRKGKKKLSEGQPPF